MSDVQTEFTCICGNQKGWIGHGDVTAPCPYCDRIYRGEEKINTKTGVTEILPIVIGLGKFECKDCANWIINEISYAYCVLGVGDRKNCNKKKSKSLSTTELKKPVTLDSDRIKILEDKVALLSALENRVAVLEALAAALKNSGQECPMCHGNKEYLSPDPGDGMLKCGLCRATGKI